MSMATALTSNTGVSGFLGLEDRPSATSSPSNSNTDMAPPPISESPRSNTPDSASANPIQSAPAAPQRRDSQYQTSSPLSSHVFLIGFYEQILKAKSVLRYPELRESTQRALDLARTEGFCRERAQLPHNIEVVLQPMLNACQTGSQTLTLIGLDGLSKLITYDYLSNQALVSNSNRDGTKDRSPVEKAVLAICSCFKGEITEDKVQTQIIKGLMAAVSSSTTIIHQEALLNAIRTLYNIFLLSRDISNQIIAQGTLVQMARSVFSRIKAPIEAKKNPPLQRSNSNLSNRTMYSEPIDSKTSNDSEDEDDSEEEKEGGKSPQEELAKDEKLSLEALGGKAAEAAANAQAQGNICDTSSDLNVLDGFLLFRALCKLSIKPYQAESSLDVRSMSLRSKLLALYLILIIVTEFPLVFTSAKVFFLTNSGGENSGALRQVREATFLTAVKPYFGLCLTRNLVATLPKIYELALAIFESVTETMRSHLKREIEVYLKEIIIPILELKPSGNQRQKHILITMFLSKLCSDPQMLVEVYLNYDCARGSLNNNIFEHLTSALSKVVTYIQPQEEFPQLIWEEADAFQLSAKLLNRGDLMNLPTLTSDRFTSNYISRSFFSRVTFTDPILQFRAMECLTEILRSLVKWSNKGQTIADSTVSDMVNLVQQASSASLDEQLNRESICSSPVNDHPTQFEQIKQEKQALQKGIELFNRKPKKGVESLIKSGIIKSSDPGDVAKFLLQSADLDKAVLGEFLGEGEVRNIDIMHAFVDQLEFAGLEFVSALRKFLQTFRLPGEAQKIDRFMLKFAERYTSQNPTEFANADTAYVLGYSVIMLNTDLHNPQVKRRMTKSEFIKNNRGIDEGKDLDEDRLNEIYDQIASNEIQLKDAPPVNSNPVSTKSLASQFDILGGRFGKRANGSGELTALESSMQMQSNAEKYLKRMLSRKAHRDEVGGISIFYSASHFEHVRPMFEVCWMPCLAAISELLKNNDNNKMIGLCLDGFRQAIHIAGLFDLDLARNALVTALGNFCFLSNIMEMKSKNLEAIRTILDIAVDDGNHLKSNWNDVLQIVNHLVRMQLVPNFSASVSGQDRSLVAHRDPHARQFNPIAMAETNTQSMLIAVDKVFAYSVKLSGPAIVDFVQALSAIALEELTELPSSFDKSKAQSSPKMFSIQKVVEVAYYNMTRIRLEWKDVWVVLNPVFNQLGCHTNDTVSSYVVDSLRQLASKFLDREELAHFQFQKEFLSPFVHIMLNNPSTNIKDMVLQCLQQMIQSSKDYLKSGWMTILQVLGAAAKDRSEDLVLHAFDMSKTLSETHFHLFATQPENFQALLSCLAQFAKNPLLTKTSLHAVEAFRVASNKMIESMKTEGIAGSNPEGSFWDAIFTGLMEMVLEVKDLEVRTRAMDYMFTYLHDHGSNFSEKFWHHLLSRLLFPLFANLGDPKSVNKVPGLITGATQGDEATVWVSTTLVHALRKFVNLFTEFFDKVFQFLDGLLDLLSVCLCQDDPTLCKVGADCLRVLLEENVNRMAEQDWQRVISIIIRLFKASSRVSDEDDGNDKATRGDLTITSRAKTAQSIKLLEGESGMAPLPVVPNTPAQQLNLCLTVISLLEDVLLQNDKIFQRLDPNHTFIILELVERAYLETKSINAKFDIADAIQKQSVSKLEKFANTALSLELSCLVCLIKVLLKMFLSDAPEFSPFQSEIEHRLIPLCEDAFHNFNQLSEYPLVGGVKNIYALWHQVVLRVGNFLCKASGSEFRTVFGPISQEVLGTLKHRHLSHEVQTMIYNVMVRVDEIYIHPTNASIADSDSNHQ